MLKKQRKVDQRRLSMKFKVYDEFKDVFLNEGQGDDDTDKLAEL